MNAITTQELAQYEHYKNQTLLPSIKLVPLNPNVKLTSLIVTMEKLYGKGEEAYKKKDYLNSWKFCMKCASYIMQELRTHSDWRTLPSKDKDRLMQVLAPRFIQMAETSEVHLRRNFVLRLRQEQQKEKEKEQQEKQEQEEQEEKQEKQEKQEQEEKKEKEQRQKEEEERHRTTTIPEYRTEISMVVNGEQCFVPIGYDPHTPLVSFLRDVLGSTGTKIGCGEGGCGACSVLMSFQEDGADKPTHRVINSCLRSIASCDGVAITTVEGIGGVGTIRNPRSPHATQERLSQCNGSQCGFCSPGWVMNAYSMLMNDPTPTSVQKVQDRFDGNLCRCTGFRPILHAFSSFVSTENQEEKCPNGTNHGEMLAKYDAELQQKLSSEPLPEVLSPLALSKPLRLAGSGSPGSSDTTTTTSSSTTTTTPSWYAPTSLTELNTVVAKLLSSATPYALELGGTSRGVSKYYDGAVAGTSQGELIPAAYVSLFRVQDLRTIAVDATDKTIKVGAAVTISKLIVTLESTGDTMHAQLSRHLSRVANLQVRNVGGWAGNLILGKRYPTFPCDLLTTLSAAGATLTIQKWKASNAPTLEHLTVSCWSYEQPPTPLTSETLLYLTIPSSPTTTTTTTTFTSYKLARRQQSSYPIINFAAHLHLSNKKIILSANIYLHGDDQSPLTHAVDCCNALLGQDVTQQETLTSALHALSSLDLKGRKSHVVSLASSLLYKTILTSQPTPINSGLSSATDWQLPRGVSTGTEIWSPPDPSSKEAPPAGLGRPKVTEILQCTGQAKYTADFSTGERNPNLLHAVVVQSTRALATVASIDVSVAEKVDDVVRVITAQDFVHGMINDCGVEGVDNGGNASPEPIFVPVGGVVNTAGQTICLVVGKTREAAKKGAAAMMDPSTSGVTYSYPKEAPILTLDDAIAKKSFFQGTHANLLERLEGPYTDIDQALAACPRTWSGTVRTAGQRHFYLETQRAVVTPTENGGLHVRSSTQGPTTVGKYVAKVTGLQTHEVECEQVRAGGGFGGKLTRNLPIACSAAVAAVTLNAPIQYVLDRVEDQKATGGREPMRMDIDVGYDEKGNIIAFKLFLFMNGGWSIDGTFGDLDMGTYWSDNAYHVPNFHVESKACRTNTPTNTSMRAPGVLHATLAIETAMDHVASSLSLNPTTIRSMNFVKVGDVTPYGQTLKYVSLDKCWSQTSLVCTELSKECKTFNAANRWVKRSVAMTPCKYGIGWGGTFSGSVVSVYGR